MDYEKAYNMSEAPDKIYLHRTTGNTRLNGKVHPYKPAKIRDDDKIIEYIRKDAILEWLCDRKKVAELTFSDSTELAGYMSAVTDFMNKFKLQ